MAEDYGWDSVNNARFALGLLSAALLVLVGVIGLIAADHPATTMRVIEGVGVVLVVAVGFTGAVFVLGYFWTDVAPVIAARLRAWRAYLTSRGGDEA